MIDKTTGLPELPEGYYWNIDKVVVEGWVFSSTSYYINIRRKTKVLGLFTITKEVFSRSIYVENLTPQGIRSRAKDVLEAWNEKMALDNILGDYPPNTLND